MTHFKQKNFYKMSNCSSQLKIDDVIFPGNISVNQFKYNFYKISQKIILN